MSTQIQPMQQFEEHGNVAQLGYHISQVANVSPLPLKVKDKWKQEYQVREIHLEDIENRLKRAENRREEFHSWTMQKNKDKTRPLERLLEASRTKEQKLQAKQQAAEHKRQTSLAEIRAKAQTCSVRREAAVERVTERTSQLAAKINQQLKDAENRKESIEKSRVEKLIAERQRKHHQVDEAQAALQQNADALRDSVEKKLQRGGQTRQDVLASTAAKASAITTRAARVRQAAKDADKAERYQLQSLIMDRLCAAEVRRTEHLNVKQLSACGSSYLPSRAIQREQLKRQVSTRRLQYMWRNFAEKRLTTAELARHFVSSGLIMDVSTGDARGTSSEADQEFSDGFEEFATKLQSKQTITDAQKLLGRIDMKLKVRGVRSTADVLLRRLYPKMSARSKIERYPVRVFLCAFMVTHYPHDVLDTSKPKEQSVMHTARDLVAAFTELIKGVLGQEQSRSLLALYCNFDDKWLAYLDMFSQWKGADAAALQADLVTMAVALQRSMMRKVDYNPTSSRVQNSNDLSAMVEQVAHDHTLFRERLFRLTGKQGVDALDAALAKVNAELDAEAKAAGLGQYAPQAPSDSEWSVISRISRQTSESITSSSTPPRPSPPMRDRTITRVQSGAGSPSVEPASEDQSESSSDGYKTPQTQSRSEAQSSPFPGSSGLGSTSSMSNEVMMLEMLLDPTWKLPTDEVDKAWSAAVGRDASSSGDNANGAMNLADLQAQVSATLVRAWWDKLTQDLANSDEQVAKEATVQIVDTLSSMAESVRGMLHDDMAAKYSTPLDSLSESVLMGQLNVEEQGAESATQQGVPNGMLHLNFNNLLTALQQLAHVLGETGAPARAAELAVEQQKIQSAVQSGEASTKDGAAKLAVHAIRLLHVQLQYLKIDMSNARLRMLAMQLGQSGMLGYMRNKLMASLNIPPNMVQSTTPTMLQSRIPNTVQLMRHAITQLPDVERYMASMDFPTSVEAAQEATQGNQALGSIKLQTGTARTATQAAVSATQSVAKPSGVSLTGPVSLSSWQAAMRVGIVMLVASQDSSASVLPETLQLNIPKLHEIQNDFQGAIVLSACLLVLSNMRGQRGLPMTPDVVSVASADIKAACNQTVAGLDRLTASITKHVLGDESVDAEEQQSVQSSVAAGLTHILSRDSGAFRALTGNLIKATYATVLWGTSVPMSSSVSRSMLAALRRSGSHLLADDVAVLAGKLCNIIAVSEGIFGSLYQKLFEGLLEEEQAANQGLE